MMPPLADPPTLVVLRDGSGIVPPERPHRGDTEPFATGRIGKINRRVIERAEAEIVLLQRARFSSLMPQMTDLGSTSVRYRPLDGEPINLEAYGLERAYRWEPDRAVLWFMIDSLVRGVGRGRPYVPDRLRISVVEQEAADAGAPLRWPGLLSRLDWQASTYGYSERTAVVAGETSVLSWLNWLDIPLSPGGLTALKSFRYSYFRSIRGRRTNSAALAK